MVTAHRNDVHVVRTKKQQDPFVSFCHLHSSTMQVDVTSYVSPVLSVMGCLDRARSFNTVDLLPVFELPPLHNDQQNQKPIRSLPRCSTCTKQKPGQAKPKQQTKHKHNHTNIQIMSSSTLTLIAKYGKERITLEDLDTATTILQVKLLLEEQTNILTKRQKLIGLAANKGGSKAIHDDLPIANLKVKNNDRSVQFILMGTPEEKIFVDPQLKDDLPDVIDDFDLDFNAGSPEWLQHKANTNNLEKFTKNTPIHVMNAPRPGKPLLVLDLDHTLLDFSSKALQRDDTTLVPGQGAAASMKRPHMDEFLTKCYQKYDMVVWSQTSWRWLETKLIELGMITNANYKFCFVLDKTSMFTVVSTKRDGKSVTHHVKPLQIIWSKFPQWSAKNTVHIDDLSRNFALNLNSGLKIKAFFRKKHKRDTDLMGLSVYLLQLAEFADFEALDFSQWMEVVAKSKSIQDTIIKKP